MYKYEIIQNKMKQLEEEIYQIEKQSLRNNDINLILDFKNRKLEFLKFIIDKEIFGVDSFIDFLKEVIKEIEKEV